MEYLKKISLQVFLLQLDTSLFSVSIPLNDLSGYGNNNDDLSGYGSNDDLSGYGSNDDLTPYTLRF